jgi:membrane protein DedA with SNARE-associated domain
LPTYTAIGAFNISFKKFLFTVLVAVGLWSGGVYYLFYSFGGIAEEILGTLKWWGLGTAAILFMILPRTLKIVGSALINKK